MTTRRGCLFRKPSLPFGRHLKKLFTFISLSSANKQKNKNRTRAIKYAAHVTHHVTMLLNQTTVNFGDLSTRVKYDK